MQDLRKHITDTAELIRGAHRELCGPQFRDEYSSLIDLLFVGSYSATLQKIRDGDAEAVEFGLVFVEVRPYYFRSQYQRTRLLRMLKQTKLSALQTERLEHILAEKHDKN
jgi:hypothetical protein